VIKRPRTGKARLATIREIKMAAGKQQKHHVTTVALDDSRHSSGRNEIVSVSYSEQRCAQRVC
jgi:hypothetical protein